MVTANSSSTKTKEQDARDLAIMQRELRAAQRADGSILADDIRGRRHEANVAAQWVITRARKHREAKAKGQQFDEAVYLRKHLDIGISNMERWIIILRNWDVYVRQREVAGLTGYTGSCYARSLIREEVSEPAMKLRASQIRHENRTSCNEQELDTLDLSRVSLITGDAKQELARLPPDSVNLFATSPPYWPAMRDFGGGTRQLGHERTVDDYISYLTSVFHEAHRVGTHDSLLMVVMGDNYGENVYNRNRSVRQERPPIGSRKQCLGTPFRFAFAMANTGWLWRMTIIWDKDGRGHPESVTDRPTTNHEYVLVFAQQRRHYWDADAVRVKRKTKEHLQGRSLKVGVIRPDDDHKHQILGQLLLKNVRSVWRIPPVPYPGGHPATLPLKLVEQMLLAGCPPGGTVCDPFSGPATVALGALRLGMKAISIDTNRKWTNEGLARLKAARTSDDDDEMLGTQEHHERLKNATVRATHWQDRYYELCRKVGEKPLERMPLAMKIAAIDATVRLPFGDLYHGDCLSVMSSLPNQSVDLAVWDLPFGVTAARWDSQIDLIQLWSHTLRLLKPHGVVIAFGVQPFTSQLVMSQPELYRHQWQRLIANASNFLRTDINPLRVVEDVLMFSGSGEVVYTPPREKLDTPYRAPIRPHKSKIYRIAAKMQNAFAGQLQDTATPISLLDLQFSPGEQQIATQKPIALMDFLIRTYTAKGATVLDPTAGSFSAGVACRVSGRRFIGIEKLGKHFQLGVRRLTETCPADVEPNREAAD